MHCLLYTLTVSPDDAWEDEIEVDEVLVQFWKVMRKMSILREDGHSEIPGILSLYNSTHWKTLNIS